MVRLGREGAFDLNFLADEPALLDRQALLGGDHLLALRVELWLESDPFQLFGLLDLELLTVFLLSLLFPPLHFCEILLIGSDCIRLLHVFVVLLLEL